jgi:hypothetical protein
MVDQGDWLRRREWYLRWGKASNWERLGIVWREHRGLLNAIGLVAVGLAAWWVWSYTAAVASWLGRYSEEVRNLMLSAGVIGAGIGVWIAFRRSETERLRQVTDSFAKAIELLAHEDRSVRLGAIYALERIARQNRDEHWPIMETLTAYVREWSERRRLEVAETESAEVCEGTPVSEPAAALVDIQAVFTILGRRRVDYERVTRSEPRRLNLAGACLIRVKPDPPPQREYGRVELSGANLYRADLSQANLLGSNLASANLFRASLFEANLVSTILRGADLGRADLQRANLAGANLVGANLKGAFLSRANLEQALIVGADLSTAIGLTQEQLNSAEGYANTKLPEGLTRPARWSE